MDGPGGYFPFWLVYFRLLSGPGPVVLQAGEHAQGQVQKLRYRGDPEKGAGGLPVCGFCGTDHWYLYRVPADAVHQIGRPGF